MDLLLRYLMLDLAGRAAILGFLLWPAFRLARKVGYSRKYAWLLCAVSAGCALGTLVLDTYLARDLDHFAKVITYFPPVLVAFLGRIVFSPFAAGVVPFIYLTFQKWPLEVRATQPEIFG